MINNSIKNLLLHQEHKPHSINELNSKMFQETRVENFFKDVNDYDLWRKWYQSGELNVGAREYGDYQTPINLAEKVCRVLLNEKIDPTTVIEPTFGLGNFISTSIDNFKNLERVYGVEIQEHYVYEFKKNIIEKSSKLSEKDLTITINNDDFFEHQFPPSLLKDSKELLIIGNPPWVTVSELKKLNSGNIPTKANIKGLKGLDAKLGKSNFDIAEYIIMKLLDLINESGKGTLAMLCKNQTAKNIVEWSNSTSWNIKGMKLFNFDAKKEFNVGVEASLFLVTIDKKNICSSKTCEVYDLDSPTEKIRTFGWTQDKFVSDVDAYEKTFDLDNFCPLTWRSGVKHDASKVFELKITEDNSLLNGFKETVDIEDTFLYSWLKSSDLDKTTIPNSTRKKVIITQRKTGADTSHISEESPKLWSYLMKHKEKVDARKSSIYSGKPSFTIFGIGDYSFAPYKVAIAGMYKKSNFSLVLPIKNKTVMLDDTCNFLSFNKYQDALFTFLILNSEKVQSFLKSITFVDAKRPYTIEILKRIDIVRASEQIHFDTLMNESKKYDIYIPLTITEEDYTEYKYKLKNNPHSFLLDKIDSNGLQELMV